MRRSRVRYLVVLAAIAATLVPVSGQANVYTCEVAGGPGEFQVKRIETTEERGTYLHLYLSDPSKLVTGEDDYHTFGGVWLLRASDLANYSWIFADHGVTFSPGRVAAYSGGSAIVDQQLPSTDLVDNGFQANGVTGVTLEKQAYYLVGFGAGNGSFRGKLTMGGTSPPVCEEATPAGRVVTYDSADFKGGTQTVASGYGHASGARLSYTTPYDLSIIALYAYQPEPFPDTRVDWSSEWGTFHYRQAIRSFAARIHASSWTASYTGKTNTLLIETLELDLHPDQGP